MTPILASRPPTQLATLTDGQLLARYVGRGDQAAFGVLVQRHGPMVLGVGRRVLHDQHDAEDAFQASFAVLARKARTICKHDSVASWLYKVAYRIALRLRLQKSRRREMEQRLPQKSSNAGLQDVADRELQQVIDEEVQRLPEKYRSPILLCCLQGQTNEEAAALLHCPTGTIKIRLLRARAMLRKRLVKRGLACGAVAALSEVLTGMAKAAVEQPLARAATQAMLGSATPAVTKLAEAALKRMCLAKLKVAALMLLTLALLCLADGLWNRAAGATMTTVGKILHEESVPTALQPTLVVKAEQGERPQ